MSSCCARDQSQIRSDWGLTTSIFPEEHSTVQQRYADDPHRIIPGEGQELPSPQEPWVRGTCPCGFRPTVESKKRTIEQIEETLLQQDRTGTWLPEDQRGPKSEGANPRVSNPPYKPSKMR